MTGWPMRTGFVGGRADHDPWRFDADRLAASREADGILVSRRKDVADMHDSPLDHAATGNHLAIERHLKLGPVGWVGGVVPSARKRDERVTLAPQDECIGRAA